MSVCIRLARQGSKKRPFYRIVATDKRSARDGRFIEQLGFWDPRKVSFQLNQERYAHWVGVGALPSETLEHLVKSTAKKA